MRKRTKKNDPTVREAYHQNEAIANRDMTKVMVFMAALLVVVFFCYLFKLFPFYRYTVIYILFPINIALLLTPLIWVRTTVIEKSGYKYFLMVLTVIVVMSLNILIPKHTMLGWAFPIILSNHYYSRRLTTRLFIAVLVMMLLCMYLAVFVGEYEANLIGTGWVIDGKVVEPDTPSERFQYLTDRLAAGDNRYLKIFLFYYIPRAAFMAVLFFASLRLDERTYNLLRREVNLKAEREKIVTELGIANQIQISALPKDFLDDDDIKMYASMNAAKEVGGDFYNFLVRGDELYFVIGDVSGKGIPAALFMMKANAYFETAASFFSSPKEIAMELNRVLLQGNDSLMFITAFIGKLNKKSGLLTFCNCGHNPPLIQKKDGHYEYLKMNSGFLLGTFETPPLKEETIVLEEECNFVTYTDGVTECKNEHNELFGEEYFLKRMNNSDFSDPKDLSEAISRALMVHKGIAEQSDDITMLLIRKKKSQGVRFEKNDSCTKKILSYVEGELEKAQLSLKVVNNMMVATDEMVSNIVNYSSAKEISVKFEYDSQEKLVKLSIIDDGEAFDPLAKTDPDIDLSAEERQIGGLGIFLVKKLMDNVTYTRENERNILILEKKA
ncbi:MAG: SpoIIE family protein phosphatase [Bacilli bacterium]|nr:SpoIIE family protein phosphatase [Bacilli bacterium]